MEWPPSRGGFFMPGTQPGTRFAKVLSPGWKELEIRNNHRQIIGYIERDGTVTNTHRQKVGTLDW